MAKRKGSRSRSSSKSTLGMNNCLLVGLCVSVVVGFMYFLKQSGVIKEGAHPFDTLEEEDNQNNNQDNNTREKSKNEKSFN